MKYHLTLVRMAIIKSLQITSAGEGVEKREPPALLLGMQAGAAAMENSMEVLSKTKLELPRGSVIPALGI